MAEPTRDTSPSRLSRSNSQAHRKPSPEQTLAETSKEKELDMSQGKDNGSSDRGRHMERLPNKIAELTQLSARLDNPLQGMTTQELMEDAERFCLSHGLMDLVEQFKRGAVLAAHPDKYNSLPNLTEQERIVIEKEKTHRWSQPWQIYYVAFMSSMAAVVQGMDEAVVNGAQVFYYQRFGLTGDDNHTAVLQGVLNAAPYICCAGLACWLTDPLNRWLGRRGTIWVSCFIAAVASIWEAFTYSRWQLFGARFLLGLGIGPKSATAPIFTAECAPAPVRGALVMQWQMWTAFGIALGDIVSVIFLDLPDDVGWRIMLGSTVVAPIIVCACIYIAPESPRWLCGKGRYREAFYAMRRLRFIDLQATRDLYYMVKLLEAEEQSRKGRNLLKDLVAIPRVRRATQASAIVMFMQQFCGVNVIAYYSTQVFIAAGFSRKNALLVTMGTGIVNWLFALPAFYTIDTFGRRNLLIVTFPAMCACLLLTGFAFYVPEGNARVGLVATGIYLFECFYSPGMGPVPFTYSAEAFPLFIRDLGMSCATAITWCFNAILSITFPLLLRAFKPQGAFGWYAAWNLIGWIAIILFLPETKSLTLEELDLVFSVPTGKHASYQVKNTAWHFRKWFLRHKEPPLPPLYEMNSLMGR